MVVDTIGGAMTELAFRSLAWGGRQVVVGFASGEIPKLPTNLVLLKGAALLGVEVRLFGINEPETAAANCARCSGSMPRTTCTCSLRKPTASRILPRP